jgi:hypothetical protein
MEAYKIVSNHRVILYDSVIAGVQMKKSMTKKKKKK